MFTMNTQDIDNVWESEGFHCLGIFNDDDEWSAERMLLLNDKVAFYIQSLHQGEINTWNYLAHPNYRIELVCFQEPNEEGKAFLKLMEKRIKDEGFAFKWRVTTVEQEFG